MNYDQLLSQSWKIVRRHKFLWLLGMMAGLLTFASSYNSTYPDMGLRVGSGYPFEVSPFGSPEQLPPETLEEFERNYERFAQDLSQIQPILVTGIVVWLLASFSFWVIELAARAGLIYAAAALDQGESMAFGTAFRRGLGKVGRLIGLKIVLTFAPLMPFFLMFILMFIIVWIPHVFKLLIPLFLIIFLFFVIAWPFVDAFAFRAVVLHDLSIIASIKRGWLLLRENLWKCLLLGLRFVSLYIAISIVIWLLFALLGFPTGWLGIAATLLVAIAFHSLFVPFQSTAVTLTYLQLLGERGARGGAQEDSPCVEHFGGTAHNAGL